MDLAEDLAYKVLDILESNEITEITAEELQRLVVFVLLSSSDLNVNSSND